MRSFAEFQILGRIGKIARVGGVLKVNIAANYPVRQDDGTWKDNTHWNTVTVFNDKLANWIEANVTKGDPAHIRGRVRQGSYMKNGAKVYTVDMAVTDYAHLAQRQPTADQAEPAMVENDDDIPF